MDHLTHVVLSLALSIALWFMLSFIVNLFTPVGWLGRVPLLACFLFVYLNMRRL